MGYTCSRCNAIVHGNVTNLLRHIRCRHTVLIGRKFTAPVACGQDGCWQTFRYSAAFKRHIENQHKNLHLDEYDTEDNNLDDPSDGDNDDFEAIDNIPAQNTDFENDNHELDKKDVTELAALTIAKMRASSSVVQSTIDNVIQESSDLFSQVITSLQAKTESVLKSKGIPEDDPERLDLQNTFRQFQNPFDNLETACQQNKYFKESNNFVQPREVPFAVAYYQRNNPATGHVDQVARRVTFQYIPLKQLLKHILESKGFMRAVAEYQLSRDEVMRDFHDGEFCRGHVFFSNGKNIALLLYVDDCEIANPLGSKAGMHKIGVIYCTILNLPAKFRSSLCNHYLVALYNAGDVKTYGFDPILQPLVDDMNDLEKDGLHITTDIFEGTVKVGIAQVTGDNLGVNGILGFVESFISHYFCRNCKMHIAEMRRALIAIYQLNRTHANYCEDLEANDPTSTGVKVPCLLNNLEHFHVTTNYVPDVMHDLLEGVCGLEVHLVLADLIHAGLFDLDLLNSRITSFDYSPSDSKNKPSPISQNKITNPDGASGQTASQMWCLIRYLPLMICDVVPEGNEHLELLLLLLECMDFIFSPEVTVGETVFLKQIIKDHHDYFLTMYPDRNLKPKHHFMTHYPQQIRQLGPLTNYWTMRFEAKHRFFKRLGHIVCNYRNILKTLAERHQMFLCYHLMCGKDLAERDVEIGPGSPTLVMSLERPECLTTLLGVHLFSDVYVANWCVVNGIKYCKNLLVHTGKSCDSLPIFKRIVYVICEGTDVQLVTELWETVEYDRHTHTYVVQPTQETVWSVVRMQDLCDHQTYHPSKSYKEDDSHHYVTLRHRII